MTILNRYVAQDYLVTFCMTVLVFTFVMCVGTVIKAIDLVARGVSWGIVFQVFAVNVPFIMMFTIPMSSLTTVLLMFSRLSLDGEITAMKSCGLNIWQIVAAPVFFSILLSVLCVYLNSVAAPNSHFANRKILRTVGVDEPMNLLEEGRFVRHFPGLLIYVGSKEKDKINDVVVYELGEEGVKRSVRARYGTIQPDPEQGVLNIDLFDVRIDQPDQDQPMDLARARNVTARKYPVKLDFREIWDNSNIEKKVPDMTMSELAHAIRNVGQVFPELSLEDRMKMKMRMVVDANQRFALALSCFAFTMLGIPLGMRSRRKESSVGVGISLLVVLVFYLFIVIADALVGNPEWQPDKIIWIPVIGGELAGLIMLRRSN